MTSVRELFYKEVNGRKADYIELIEGGVRSKPITSAIFLIRYRETDIWYRGAKDWQFDDYKNRKLLLTIVV